MSAPASSASAGSTGGAGGGFGGASAFGDTAALNEPEQQRPGTQIAVNIQGNILDRRQTGLEIAEVINEVFGTNGVGFATGVVR